MTFPRILLTFPYFSDYREMVQNISHNMCVTSGGVVLPSFAEHCVWSFGDMTGYIIVCCIVMCSLVLAPIIFPFPVDINNVKCNINTDDINTNYVFLPEYSN
jgi:hypothetical protein